MYCYTSMYLCNFRCISNCFEKSASTDEIEAVVLCDNCQDAEYQYAWTINSQSVDLVTDTTTGPNRNYLKIKANVFNPQSTYQLTATGELDYFLSVSLSLCGKNGTLKC